MGNINLSTLDLFSPCSIGSVNLDHRVVMSSMTRLRCDSYLPTDDVVSHYRQRSSRGGLILSESIAVNHEGVAWSLMSGIWDLTQVRAWKNVTRAVHCQDGKIFAQLFHAGRISHSSISPGNVPPSAPSAIRPAGLTVNAYGQRVPYETPTEMTLPVINRTIKSYVQAAKNCVASEFDGIELHCGDGFLLQQFMNSKTNCRADKYGDPLELIKEIITNIKSTVDIPIGIKITPFSVQNDITSDSIDLYENLLSSINDMISYITVTEPRINEDKELSRANLDRIVSIDVPLQSVIDILRPNFSGAIIGVGGFQPNSIIETNADLVAFGRWFTSNPALPNKIKNKMPLTMYDTSTFYRGGKNGYTTFM